MEPRVTEPGWIEAFVAVVRRGTVVAAAAALGRTQPTISARIQALERAWGVRLFDRRGRGMRLTAEGERLLPLAERALAALGELDRQAGVPLAAAGELRVGSGDALGRELLPSALRRLIRAEPELQVQVREGPRDSLLDALAAGEIDLALVAGPAGRPELTAEPLLESPVRLLAPPAWLGSRRTVRLESLRGQRLVALQRGSEFRRQLRRAFSVRDVPFRASVEVGNLSLARRYVAAGLGLAPVPAVAFGGDRMRGVAEARLAGVEPVAYHAVTRAGVPLPDTCRALLESLRVG